MAPRQAGHTDSRHRHRPDRSHRYNLGCRLVRLDLVRTVAPRQAGHTGSRHRPDRSHRYNRGCRQGRAYLRVDYYHDADGTDRDLAIPLPPPGAIGTSGERFLLAVFEPLHLPAPGPESRPVLDAGSSLGPVKAALP